jgi:hypothetical protein
VGQISPAIHGALLTIQQSDHRLSSHGSYVAVLDGPRTARTDRKSPGVCGANHPLKRLLPNSAPRPPQNTRDSTRGVVGLVRAGCRSGDALQHEVFAGLAPLRALVRAPLVSPGSVARRNPPAQRARVGGKRQRQEAFRSPSRSGVVRGWSRLSWSR